MKNSLSLLLFLFSFLHTYSQDRSTEDLLIQARTAAYTDKDYIKAINLTREIVEKDPDNMEAAVFLGRLYTWNKDLQSARAVFYGLEEKGVKDQDFYAAYASLEYWNGANSSALEILDRGLSEYPVSQELLLLKAKVQQDINAFGDARKTLDILLSKNPKNTEARELAAKIHELSSKNAVEILYGFTHFNTQFQEDWHLLSISYKRVTPIGPLILRGNYANKFAQSGTQLELEAYPRISKNIYLYVGGAYSNDMGIFPKYRHGISLNATLPRSFEAEIGYRQLFFTDHIWLYTASLGKYYRNLWFNVRTYISPDKSNISHSYTGTLRYYVKGGQDYLALQAGTGITPEENRSNLLSDQSFKTKTYKIGAEYNFAVKKTAGFSLSTMYYNQEYQPGKWGNQYDITVGYSKKF